MNILINEHLRRKRYSGVLKRLTHDVSVTASQHALDYNSPPTSGCYTPRGVLRGLLQKRNVLTSKYRCIKKVELPANYQRCAQ